MFVAALSQLAECEAEIHSLPSKIGIEKAHVHFESVTRSSIQARKFDVHVHEDGHEHHADHHHDHVHRHLSDIQKIINDADLSNGCKQRALDIFQRLGDVEAQAHGIPIENVHFHEVGAIDSIIDIIAAALCLDTLDIHSAYYSDICVGHGQVKTAHGVLPVPAPATERLLHGFNYHAGELSGEWTTPTGAAILAHLQAKPITSDFHVEESAYGAGGKDSEKRANVLRLRLATANTSDRINIIQCNVDDMPAELLGADFTNSVMQAGARDISIRPLLMKKGRPGFLIEVLAASADTQKLSEFLCQHTTTIGVRVIEAERYILDRRPTILQTEYGEIAAKIATLPDGNERCLPEYEACAQLAKEKELTVLEVYNSAKAKADSLFND